MADESTQLSDFDERLEDPSEDPLFNFDEDTSHGHIFTRKELLKVGHVPESTRIVGRDEEIEAVATELRPIVQQQPPNNTMIYGKTGTGKSLVAQHVTERARRAAEAQGVAVGTVYVDCAQHNTQTRVARSITRSLNESANTGFDIPRSGIGSGEYYDYLWEILDEVYDAVIIVLDEVDRLEDDDVLMQLSRARESGKADCHLGIIAISNKIEYRDELNERVKSSLREEEFVFQPYDANQLREIMNHRRDAFRDDVLTEDVIPLTAAFAAQEHGDARKAIEILRHAGELAERQGVDLVQEKHVRDAQEWAEIDRFEELLRGSTTQVKFILYSLAMLTEEHAEEEFSTSQIYERYKRTTERLEASVLSEHRVYELLKEQAFLGVVESTRTGGGRGQGSYLEHRLVQDTDIVLKSVLRDSRLDNLT
ncbi:orc1/cdc6 family replication initiation protein [Halobacteria archaeon AArc-m2/3/4]|uniref:ORC1-type DNA replication protein n=1 Tax=Natronoglomus mannanivorans TaxID=2979990 RepID=A0AAP2YXE9_9EURY|nr:orc1/cdc6 family replication initiation protein [Halobacteria archaeon AArc-xg1-1]MCU4973779.1 orc1/cdc6 family replication initiation protein [Halobacteria archaeon AArc-m2/3/4]